MRLVKVAKVFVRKLSEHPKNAEPELQTRLQASRTVMLHTTPDVLVDARV